MNFALGRLLLVGNFPLIVAGCASLAALLRRVRKLAPLFRASLRSLPVILTALYFLKVSVTMKMLSNGNLKHQPAPLKSTVRARLFFGNSVRTV